MGTPGGSGDGQTALWNGAAGQAWVEAQGLLDRMFRPIEELLADAAGAAPGGRVLDVGCGTGGTTVAAARRVGPGGGCVGVDISEPMIAGARARAAREGVPASFVCADAGTHAFEAGGFDLVVSRFGVMFFDDPVAAFANLRRATGAGGGLRLVVWRGPEENPFMTTAERAAAPLLPDLPPRRPDAPGQFAFADAGRVRRILEEAGWRAVDARPVDFPCAIPEAELTPYLTRLGPVGRALEGAGDDLRRKVVEAVRPAFDPYVQGAEVRFTAACWSIGAQATAG